MTTDKQDPSRKAFEAWAETVDIDTSKWFDYPDIYKFKSAETSWVAWQASREQALDDVAQELVGMSCNNATARSAIKVCIETIKEMK